MNIITTATTTTNHCSTVVVELQDNYNFSQSGNMFPKIIFDTMCYMEIKNMNNSRIEITIMQINIELKNKIEFFKI